MRHQDPRVPAEVEEYLVGLYTRAGQLGAGIGADVGFPGGDLLRRGRPPRARGVTWVARQLTTVVEERTVTARLLLWDVRRLLASRYPKSHRLDTSDDVIRLAVPVRRTGLQ